MLFDGLLSLCDYKGINNKWIKLNFGHEK